MKFLMIKKIKLFKPFPVQQSIINEIENISINYIVAVLGRRSGKTELVINTMTKYALENENSNILYCTYNADMRVSVFGDYLDKFSNQKFIHKINKSNFIIKFSNGSKIWFRLGILTSANSLRGKKFDYIVLDEFALYNPDVWNMILAPTLLTMKNPKTLFLSTPRGRNQLYDFYLKGLDNNFPNWKSFNFPSSSSPLVNDKFLEERRLDTPDFIFKQEYLAEFVDSSSAIFLNMDTALLKPFKKGNSYYAGIDVAGSGDYNVCMIINEHGHMIDYIRFHGLTLDETADKFAEFLKKYKNPTCYVEINYQEYIYNLLIQRNVSNIIKFRTLHNSKNKIIQNLILRFDNLTIKLIDDAQVRLEFSAFDYFYNPKTQNITYKARDPFNDDIVMATALAFNSLIAGNVSWS